MQKNVVIVGLGYVGLPLALLAKKKGFDVIGVDYSTEKVAAINAGKSPFTDEAVEAELQELKLVAYDTYLPVDEADIVVICVPTPVDEQYMPDLTPVINATVSVAAMMKPGQLIVVESTINPGVYEDVVIPLLEGHSGLVCGKDFFLAHCPERINPGDTKWSVSNIARVVGANDSKSLALAVEFYEHVIDARIKPMGSLKEAEAVKVVENSFRDVNIAFVNELAMSFNALDINVMNVIDGAATKPFAFMPHYPGIGVGGHCIPVDPYYLIEHAKKKGFTHHFLQTARGINQGMPAFTIKLLTEELEKLGLTITTAKIIVLGLSYKADVGDIRESPSLDVIKQLLAKNANVQAFDSYVTKIKDVPLATLSNGELAVTLNDAVHGADAVIIATAHKTIKAIDLQMLKQAGVKVLIDGRNCLDKEAVERVGIAYRGIGK